ncbi:MAG: formate--tetrahydrofolate ligase [Candidatus Omnitrophica bacterium]|nr:formate--tetrahydrofolate ligase [Candidatus Omnitrophota bacterium]
MSTDNNERLLIPMISDIQISRSVKPKSIKTIASALGIPERHLVTYGPHVAKIGLGILDEINSTARAHKRQGKYILVTAITPTPLGEGKTVTSIGLSMALHRLGTISSVCIRQPSMGPAFGIKGGAAGGGYSQVLPREDLNLHFTGDAHAVSIAHNLAAAFLDNSLFRKNLLDIDPEKIYWRRVVDISDRFLRSIMIGLGGKENGTPRESGFDITSASELMAILALSENIRDLKKRLGSIVVAYTRRNKAVTARDLHVDGSMAVLLKDAIKPNLIQTIEHTPCFVHTGPFANIAHGNSSIIADRIALHFSDYVVTESGFGADCGAEKFFDIKCRESGLIPDAAVIVCSLRGLKAHSGRFTVVPGKCLDPELTRENLCALEEGFCNLVKQIENVKTFGIPVVVAINRFKHDTDREIEFVRQKAIACGADDCQPCEFWKHGSRGGVGLAKAVVRAAELPKKFKFLYPLRMPIEEKIRLIARKMYGAKDVEFSKTAREKISIFTRNSWDRLPICMAKTQLSLGHDPCVKGVPRDYLFPVRDIRAAVGAGFLIPLCGKIQTMPGLPGHPIAEKIRLDDEGNIQGPF